MTNIHFVWPFFLMLQSVAFKMSYQTKKTLLFMSYEDRFNNVARLYDGEISLHRLRGSHCCVVGLGGVGSWVCEGLIRSGVGSITLIDHDDICISNINRQLQALSSTVGQFKADALKNRLLDINPEADINIMYDFIRADNIYSIMNRLNRTINCMIDAADGVSDKAVSCLLIYIT